MKRIIFTKSIRILIITLLLLAVLFQKERSQTLMVAAVILWLVAVLGSIFFRHSGRILKRCRNGLSSLVQSFSEKDKKSDECIPSAAAPVFFTEQEPISQNIIQDASDKILLHISLRISDKLKSAYPSAVWQWKETPILQNILSGQTIRISVENMENFSHADISFDRFGRIHVEPMVIGSFAAAPEGQPSATPTPEEPEAAEPPVVDVNVWYELIGQKILDSVITELNTKGHTCLTIHENGDIVINRQKKEVVQATLASFPGKNYWDELVTILEENELKGKIAGNNLQISWI